MNHDTALNIHCLRLKLESKGRSTTAYHALAIIWFCKEEPELTGDLLSKAESFLECPHFNFGKYQTMLRGCMEVLDACGDMAADTKILLSEIIRFSDKRHRRGFRKWQMREAKRNASSASAVVAL